MSKIILESNSYEQTSTLKDIDTSNSTAISKNLLKKENKSQKTQKIEKTKNCKRSQNTKKNSQTNKKLSKNKQSLKKGQWSVQEDKLLEQWIEKNGPRKWNQCGRFITGRTGKQCREHWNNCLNPELIKGEWTPEEDFLIMHFYEKCNGSWKKIIPLFSGRTENSIKNRFFSQLRKIATKDLGLEDRKVCAKIKLGELKKFLKVAVSEAKDEFLNYNQMNEEELNNYINKMELKIKKKNLEESENSENLSLSTNLGDLENSRKLCLETEGKEKSFLCKKKRAENEELDKVLNSFLNEGNIEYLNEENNKRFEIKEKPETKNEFDDNIKFYNNFEIKEFENLSNKDNDNISQLSLTHEDFYSSNIFENNHFDNFEWPKLQLGFKDDFFLCKDLLPNLYPLDNQFALLSNPSNDTINENKIFNKNTDNLFVE